MTPVGVTANSKTKNVLKMTIVSNQQQQSSGAAFRIIGNVVRELDMRIDAQQTLARFTIAVDDPTSEKEASYFYVRCFDQLAREAGMMLVKGSRIEVWGTMETWQNRAARKSGVFFNVKKIKPLARCRPLPATTSGQKQMTKSELDEWVSSYDAAAADLARQEAQFAPRHAGR